MADDTGAYITLASVPKGLPKSFRCVITQYTKGYTSQQDNNVVRNQKNFTPRRVKENDLQLTIMCRNVAEYDDLKQRISFAQRAALGGSVSDGFVRFSYPAKKMDYIGFIINGPEGANRFDIAPTITVSLLLMKDTINSTASQFSSLDGATFQDIYGPSVADLYGPSATPSTFADGILASNPPLIGGGGGGRGPTAQ